MAFGDSIRGRLKKSLPEGVRVPEHVANEWFVPDFVPGLAPCVLQGFAERKSRLGAGGTFFRSKNVGPKNNNIRIECVWLTNTLDGSFQPIGTIEGTSKPLLFNSVWLKVYNGVEVVENWYASQTQTSPGDPGAETPIPPTWLSAIPSLQSRINADPSSLIEMNVDDVQFPWPKFDNEEPPAEIIPTYLNMFPIRPMNGATGGPTRPNEHRPKIRTGPAESLILIASSEKDTTDGKMKEPNDTKSWNGACWVKSDPKAPDAVDPENPRGIGVDPSSKCPV